MVRTTFTTSPKGARVQPALDLGELEARAASIFAAAAATQLIFAREPLGPALAQAVDLPARQSREAGEFIRRDQCGRCKARPWLLQRGHFCFPCEKCECLASLRLIELGHHALASARKCSLEESETCSRMALFGRLAGRSGPTEHPRPFQHLRHGEASGTAAPAGTTIRERTFSCCPSIVRILGLRSLPWRRRARRWRDR